MRVTETRVPGCVLIEPRLFPDERGVFLETYSRERYAMAGVTADFVQDNFSRSRRGALRGLHYQVDRPQGKLVWILRGEVFDVVVDLRRSSPEFGRWTAVTLSAESCRQVYVPPGCAHGFYTLSEEADVAYKCTDYYSPASERTILWSDPSLAIDWPSAAQPILSEKDARGVAFADAPTFE